MIKQITEITVYYQRKLNLGNFQTCDIGVTLTAGAESDGDEIHQDIQGLLDIARMEVKKAATEITRGKNA